PDGDRRRGAEALHVHAVEADERHALVLQEGDQIRGEGGERRTHDGDPVPLDELLGRRPGPVGVAAVVLGDEVHPVAVDAAGVVDRLEVGPGRLLRRAAQRRDPAREREDATDLVGLARRGGGAGRWRRASWACRRPRPARTSSGTLRRPPGPSPPRRRGSTTSWTPPRRTAPRCPSWRDRWLPPSATWTPASTPRNTPRSPAPRPRGPHRICVRSRHAPHLRRMSSEKSDRRDNP